MCSNTTDGNLMFTSEENTTHENQMYTCEETQSMKTLCTHVQCSKI
jgi:hypothetical protein